MDTDYTVLFEVTILIYVFKVCILNCLIPNFGYQYILLTLESHYAVAFSSNLNQERRPLNVPG